jgi:hypothetical protein
MQRCASSLVIAAYENVRLMPRDSVVGPFGMQMPHAARFKDFSGSLPAKRSDRNGNCLSAIRREFCRCSEASGCRVEKDL